MALIRWSDQYSVNIPSIDAQHRVLVDLLNVLHDSVQSGSSQTHLGALLQGLLDYTWEHFSYEERLFTQHAVPQADEHVAEHRKLAGQVLVFRYEFQNGTANIDVQLLDFLNKWLTEHVQGTDRAYSEHLISRGVQ